MTCKELFNRRLPSARGRAKRLWLAALVCALAVLGLRAEHLSVRIFTSADGLGSSFIDYLMRDSRGFLWICSRDGLSRFDGSRFVTYQIGETGEVAGVESIFEQSNGTYWVGTTNGLYRFTAETLSSPDTSANGRPRLNAERIGDDRGTVMEDRNGKLWFVSAGLFEVIEQDHKVVIQPVDLHLSPDLKKGLNFVDSPEGKDGSLWLPAPKGLIRRLPDGRVIFFETETESPQNAIAVDGDGRVWASRGKELFVIDPDSVESMADLGPLTIRKLEPAAVLPIRSGGPLLLPNTPGEIYKYTSEEFLQKHIIRRIFMSSDGHMWMPTERNLVEYDGSAVHLYTPDEGFPPAMGRMTEDMAGNIWFGGYSGLVRLDRSGMSSYGTSDGLTSPNIYSIFESPHGTIYAATAELSVSEWDGVHFTTVHPQLDPDSTNIWTSPFAFVDREGDWWFLTQKGLCRYANVKDFTDLNGRRPTEIFDSVRGLPNNEAFHIFEDRSGDVWFSQLPLQISQRSLVRWSRATGEIHVLSAAEGYPSSKSVMSFAEDRFGNLWMGFYEGGLARFKDGKFTVFGKDAGLPASIVTDLYIDHLGRMWIASALEGLLVMDDTSAERPAITRITTDQGLSTNNIRTITEDNFGRIYLGTVRGVDRLSPDTMRVKHFSVNDGLPADFVVDSHRDSRGDLWFATTNGIARITPIAEGSGSATPNVFIGDLLIAGERRTLPQLGAQEIDKGDLSSSENNLQIDFFGLGFRAGESLRYQYKLDGTDTDWTAPSDLRTVTFARLSPGSYRFLVRAVNSDGLTSTVPASLTFRILSPIWQRWWFIAIAALLLILIVVLVYRYRTARLREVNTALDNARAAEERLRLAREERIVELENVRSRIATDLHDDIGASLTQIAVLSEVAQTQSGNGGRPHSLRRISEVSNELIGTMSDIVWAINPAKDHLSDLTQRMRRFAADVLTPLGIAVHFVASDSDNRLSVKTNARREIFLVFKECVNNIAKHSGAKHVKIALETADDKLTLKVSDDGNGLADEDHGNALGGNGIRNMRRRADEVGGTFEIHSTGGRGTNIIFSLPTTESLTG